MKASTRQRSGGARHAPPRGRAAQVPAFALYGEAGAPGAFGAFGTAAQEPVHIEAVQSRSRLYRWEIEPHVHQGLHQVLWLGQGEAELSLDEMRVHCAAPAAVVIPPGSVHGFHFAPESDGFVLTLDARGALEGDGSAAGAALGALFDSARVLPMTRGDAATARIESLLAALLAEFHAPGPAASPVPVWLARAAIWVLAQHAASRGPPMAADAARRGARTSAPARAAPGLFTRFVVLVEAQHRAHWPVERYAATLGLSRERLNRLVRAETGRNALALVHERLLREACRRLIYIEAPVASLAYELGFEDAAYFTRFFKRMTGMAPSEYRARHRPGA